MAWQELGSARWSDGRCSWDGRERETVKAVAFIAPIFARHSCMVHICPSSHAPCSAHTGTVSHTLTLSQVYTPALR